MHLRICIQALFVYLRQILPQNIIWPFYRHYAFMQVVYALYIQYGGRVTYMLGKIYLHNIGRGTYACNILNESRIKHWSITSNI